MGCIPLSLKKNSKQPTVGIIYSTTTNNSLQSSVEIKRPEAVFSRCEKCSSTEQSDGFEIVQAYQLLLDLGINCPEEYKLIADLDSAFWINYSVFKNSVHGSCIPNFTLSKGLKVMLFEAYINLNPSSPLTNPSDKFPFFSVPSDHKQIFSNLNEFLYFTKHIYNSQEFVKSLLQVEYVLKSLQNIEISTLGAEYTQALEILSKAVKDGKKLLATVKALFSELKSLFQGFSVISNESKTLKQAFAGFSKCSAYNIVHFLSSPVNTTGVSL